MPPVEVHRCSYYTHDPEEAIAAYATRVDRQVEGRRQYAQDHYEYRLTGDPFVYRVEHRGDILVVWRQGEP